MFYEKNFHSKKNRILHSEINAYKLHMFYKKISTLRKKPYVAVRN